MSELLALSRMARRLGVTQQWLREQSDAGKIPYLKADKRYLFNSAAVFLANLSESFFVSLANDAAFSQNRRFAQKDM